MPRFRAFRESVFGLLICGWPLAADAQSIPGGAQATSEHRPLALELGILSGSLSYAMETAVGTAVGLSAGAGAQIGLMLASDRFSNGAYAPDRFFVELAHAAVFVRLRPSPRAQIEAGPRVAWMYHPPTEYETVFYGVYAAAFIPVVTLRLGTLSIGPRLQFGRLTESAGTNAWNVAVVPVAGRIDLRW